MFPVHPPLSTSSPWAAAASAFHSCQAGAGWDPTAYAAEMTLQGRVKTISPQQKSVKKLLLLLALKKRDNLEGRWLASQGDPQFERMAGDGSACHGWGAAWLQRC